MGGSKSAPKPKQEAPKLDPMIAYMGMMQQQQAAQAQTAAQAQADAQRQAMIQSQQQAGQQAMIQGQQAAQQSLANMNASQQTADKSAMQSVQNAGQAAVGTTAGQVRQQSLQGIGATPMPGMTTAGQMANQGTGGTAQASNKFQTPSANGLTFGGA